MTTRILIVPQLLSQQSKWKYESGLLLPVQLANHLSRRGDVHTHIALPGDAVFIPPSPRVTLHSLPPLYPFDTIPTFGSVANMKDLVELIALVGPDIIIATNSNVALLLASLIDGDRLVRMGRFNVPLVLWDIQPDYGDITERSSNIAGSRLVPFGLSSVDHTWFCGLSTERAALSEVRKWFGFSTEARVQEHSQQFPGIFSRSSVDDAVNGIPITKYDTFTVHIGGRWSRTKNHDMVCKSLMALKGQGEDIDIVWTGPRSKKMDKWVSELGIDVREGLTQQEMWLVSRRCHVGIIAQDPQALPCMPFEQMALGLPVLVMSTKHTSEVMPRYPLVFSGESELIALLGHVMMNYKKSVDDCMRWFDKNWVRYDVSLVDGILDTLQNSFRVDTNVFYVGDDGRVHLPKSKTMLLYLQSIFSHTVARRTAINGGAVEDIDSPIPVFRKEE